MTATWPPRPVCAQVKYNLIDRAAEDELAPACQQFGLSIVPFGPLHGGLLAGMQVEEREFSGDRRFGGSGFTDTELEIGRAVERLSQEWGLQPYQVSLAWLLSRPAVASAIVGAETAEEVTANATAGRRHLGPGPARRPDGTASRQGQLNETAPCPRRRRRCAVSRPAYGLRQSSSGCPMCRAHGTSYAMGRRCRRFGSSARDQRVDHVDDIVG